MKKVTVSVRIRTTSPVGSLEPMIFQIANVERVTMEILMKLLRIRIVASSLLGFASNVIIRFSLGYLDCSQLSSSSRVNEK